MVVHTFCSWKKVSNERREGGRALPRRMLSTISFSGQGRSKSATETMSVQAIATTKFHFSAARLRVTIFRNLVFNGASVQHCLSGAEELRQLLQRGCANASD